jgi:sugar phosphate isomerase/epimerase
LATLVGVAMTTASAQTEPASPASGAAAGTSLTTMPLGLFETQGDIGNPAHAGSATYDPATGEYRLSGGGADMWGASDSFHFCWTRLSGDFALTADIAWPAPGGHPHRKAVLIVRASLAPDSAYVDAALHGSGLAALQFRENPGDQTRDIWANVTSPTTLRLERQGHTLWMSWAKPGQRLQSSGCSVRVALPDTVYVGLGVCGHSDQDAHEAVFSNVSLEHVNRPVPVSPRWESTLEIMTLATGQRQVVATAPDLFEAPNWSRDGRTLIVNRHGGLWRIPVEGGEFTPIENGGIRCNNDHGLSPDGTLLAISGAREEGRSHVYILPATGGAPRLITPLSPSYWHGWSPDGKTLAYCAERNGNFDVYTISVDGGEEHRLTTAPELDDGPDYSPDGQWIYFNSARTDRMQIWRMHPDGSAQQALTTDRYNNWFAHPSPDGRQLVFISFNDDVPKDVHPPGKEVLLRIMPAEGGEPRVLTNLFGGQGTINVSSWSPDGTRIAYVSYREMPAADFRDQIGLQIYSLRKEAALDLPWALDRITADGFTAVEPAGTYGVPAPEFANMLRARGLKAVSAHFQYADIQKDLAGAVRDAQALGVSYVACPWIPHEGDDFDVAAARKAVADFNRWGAAFRAAGIRFCYHPHGYEFQPAAGGPDTVFDVMARETNPDLVDFEMDVFWVYHAGQDPVALLHKYPNRWRLMHVKDMRKGAPHNFHTGRAPVADEVAVGTGQIDWPAVVRAAEEVGVQYYFIEDETSAPVQNIPKSLAYLRSLNP